MKIVTIVGARPQFIKAAAVSRGEKGQATFKKTDTKVIPELLSNETGIMIEEKNSQQLALAIKKLIENENFRKNIGRQGYEKVCKEFNIQKNTEKLLGFFEYYS